MSCRRSLGVCRELIAEAALQLSADNCVEAARFARDNGWL